MVELGFWEYGRKCLKQYHTNHECCLTLDITTLSQFSNLGLKPSVPYPPPPHTRTKYPWSFPETPSKHRLHVVDKSNRRITVRRTWFLDKESLSAETCWMADFFKSTWFNQVRIDLKFMVPFKVFFRYLIEFDICSPGTAGFSSTSGKTHDLNRARVGRWCWS